MPWDDPRLYTWEHLLRGLAGLAIIAGFVALLLGIRKLQYKWGNEHRRSRRILLVAILAAVIVLVVAVVYWFHRVP